MGTYQPQDSTGLGSGAPAPYDPNAPAYDPSGNDQLSALTNWIQWYKWCNTGIQSWTINGLRNVSAELAASSALASPQAELASLVSQAKAVHAAGTTPPHTALAEALQRCLRQAQGSGSQASQKPQDAPRDASKAPA